MGKMKQTEEEGKSCSRIRKATSIASTTITPLFQAQCTLCPFLSDYDTLFRHGVESHGIYICVCCSTHYNFAKELMVHLYREHRVPPQRFSTDNDFFKCGGQETLLCCVDCSQIFDMSDTNECMELDGHECNKKIISCTSCGDQVLAEYFEIHEKECKSGDEGRKKKVLVVGRNRKKLDESYNTQVSITLVPPSPDQPEGKRKVNGDLKRELNGVSNGEHDDEDEDRLVIHETTTNHSKILSVGKTSVVNNKLSHKKMFSAVTQSPEAFEGTATGGIDRPRRAVRKLTSDDFVYETVSKRKKPSTPLNFRQRPFSYSGANTMEVLELKKKIKAQDQLNAEPISEYFTPKLPKLRLKYTDFKSYTPPSRTEEGDLTEMKTRYPDPLFLEKDPSKRLLMLIEELCDKLSQKWPGRDMPGFTYQEQDTFQYDIGVSYEHLASQLDEDILTDMLIKTSVNCTYCRQVKLIRIDKRQLAIHLLSKHLWTLSSPVNDKIVDNIENTETVINEDDVTPKQEISSKIDCKQFRIEVLKKVFHSTNYVYTFKGQVVEFGEAPCECLLCGYSVDSQKNLFSHWRKIHRGVAMKCAMCQGRFLFAGALYSHLCLGTPNPVIKYEIDRAVPSSGGKNHPDVGLGAEFQVETHDDDESAYTIVLRYQCNICENVQLPGFFNYMVHLRKEHNRCELCLEALRNQKDLEHHMKKHKLNHFCWRCGVTYCAQPNFLTHLFWKHGSESKDCSVCLKKKWPHIYHFCVPPQVFSCETCKFQFTKATCLVVHRRLHTGQKLRKCPSVNCTEQFISKKLLDKHVIAVHNNAIMEASAIPIKSDPDATKITEPAVIKTEGESATIMQEKNEEPEDDSVQIGATDSADHEVDQKVHVNETEVIPKADGLKVEEPVENESDFLPMFCSTQDSIKTEVTDVLEPTANPIDGHNDTNKVKEEEIAPDNTPCDTLSTTAEGSTSAAILLETTAPESLSSSSVVNSHQESSISGPENIQKLHDADDVLFLDENETDNKINTSIDESTKADNDPDKPFNIEEVQGPNLSEEDESGHSDDNSDSESTSSTRSSLHSRDREVSTDVLCIETGTAKSLDSVDNDNPVLESEVDAVVSNTEDFGSMSPLLEPLDDFSFNAVNIPTFEDNSLPEHIIRENAMFSIMNEHDYCLRVTLKRSPSSPMYSSCSRSQRKAEFGGSRHKKLKTSVPKGHSSRKRHHSSSSSSSSSCGSNCSCSGSSSSSSSSSESSDEEGGNANIGRPGAGHPYMRPILKQSISSQPIGPPIKRGRGRPKGSVNRNKDGIPTAKKRAPGGAGKRIGRIVVPKPPRPLNPDGTPMKRKYRKQKGKFSRKSTIYIEHNSGVGEDSTTKENFPEENYILETDLETDSDSEEIYNNKQLNEAIGKIPNFDEIWTMSNEQYLLKFMRGVKDVDELSYVC